MKTLVCLTVLVIAVAAHSAAAIDTSAPSTSASATAPSKLWATDLPAFINQKPRGHWIVAASAQPALSAAEAEAFARANAADQIVSLIDPEVRRAAPGNLLRQQVSTALRKDDWIVDRLVQSDDRPYGTIWRESLLIDASPRKIEDLSRQIQHLARRETGRRAAMFGGGIILFIIVSLAYLFLNWLTRGYLRLRLAMISIIVMTLGIAVLAGLAHLV